MRDNNMQSLQESGFSICSQELAAKSRLICTMSRIEILELQSAFRLGQKWGQIVFPEEWMPLSQVRGGFTVDLNKRIKHTRNETEKDLAIECLTRLVLLALSAPSTTGSRQRKVLSPTTVYACLTSPWLKLVNLVITRPPRIEQYILSRLDPHLVDDYRCSLELRRLADFHAQGLWLDYPTNPIYPIHEQTNKTSKARPRTPESSNPYLPLPDTFVQEAGRRAAWITINLTPLLLAAYRMAAKMRHNHKGEFTRRVTKKLSAYEWRTEDGRPMESLPFELQLRGFRELISWPPKCWEHLNAFLNMAQMAHYFIVALSSGPRASEILSFTTDCLVEAEDGVYTAQGRTYKLVDNFDGALRTWPMPALAIQALRQQTLLSQMVPPDGQRMLYSYHKGPMPLWRILDANFNYGGSLRGTYNEELRRFAVNLEIEHLLDEQPLTNHRFRKTIARLVAIAFVHAPKILMDIFGHASIETTMHYILSDPNVRAEMNEVRKELVLMVAKNAIANAATNGGPAAETIRSSLEKLRFRKADEFGAEDEHELALMFTGQGRYWQYVRPGVICTKLQDQVGPCAKGQSMPNPSRCTSQCTYRLEEAQNRRAIEEIMPELLALYRQANAKSDIILAELWEGQIIAQLERFDCVSASWRKDEIIDSILQKAASREQHS